MYKNIISQHKLRLSTRQTTHLYTDTHLSVNSHKGLATWGNIFWLISLWCVCTKERQLNLIEFINFGNKWSDKVKGVENQNDEDGKGQCESLWQRTYNFFGFFTLRHSPINVNFDKWLYATWYPNQLWCCVLKLLKWNNLNSKIVVLRNNIQL